MVRRLYRSLPAASLARLRRDAPLPRRRLRPKRDGFLSGDRGDLSQPPHDRRRLLVTPARGRRDGREPLLADLRLEPHRARLELVEMLRVELDRDPRPPRSRAWREPHDATQVSRGELELARQPRRAEVRVRQVVAGLLG